MEVNRILQVKQAHEEANREEARKAVDNSRLLHAELQAKLQEMAAVDSAAMQTFTKQRERIASESMPVGEQHKRLQSASTSHTLAPGTSLLGSLPPHLQQSSVSTSEDFLGASQANSGSAGPTQTATGFATLPQVQRRP
jgi:hypothetical protein